MINWPKVKEFTERNRPDCIPVPAWFAEFLEEQWQEEQERLYQEAKKAGPILHTRWVTADDLRKEFPEQKAGKVRVQPV